jgi:hypothetical protein
MIEFTAGQVWVIAIISVMAIIGICSFISQVSSFLRLAYEAKLDREMPARLNRFYRKSYAEGVKDASPKEIRVEKD